MHVQHYNYISGLSFVFIYRLCLSYTHTVAMPGECDFGSWQCAAYGAVVFFIILALAIIVFCLCRRQNSLRK